MLPEPPIVKALLAVVIGLTVSVPLSELIRAALAEGDDPGVGVVAGDVPQGAVVGHARAVEGQGFRRRW